MYNLNEKNLLIDFNKYIKSNFFKDYKILDQEISGNFTFTFLVLNADGYKLTYKFFIELFSGAIKSRLSITGEDKTIVYNEFSKYFDIEKVNIVLNEIKEKGVKYGCIENPEYNFEKFKKISKVKKPDDLNYSYVFSLTRFPRFTSLIYKPYIQKNRNKYNVENGFISIEFYIYYSNNTEETCKSNISIKFPINFNEIHYITIQEKIHGIDLIDIKYKNEIKKVILKEFNLLEISDDEIENYIKILAMKFY